MPRDASGHLAHRVRGDEQAAERRARCASARQHADLVVLDQRLTALDAIAAHAKLYVDASECGHA